MRRRSGNGETIETALNLLLVANSIDDTIRIRDMLQSISSGQYSIERLTTLRSALKRIEENSYDVIISDLDLPDSPVEETAFKICQAAPEIPLIVLTEADDERLESNAIKAGAQDFLVKKKLDQDMLSRAVRHSIERKHLDRHLRQARRRLRILHDTAAKLGKCTKKKQAYRIALESAGKLLGKAMFQVLQEKNGALVTIAATSQLSERIGSEVSIDLGLAGIAFVEKRTIRFSSHDDAPLKGTENNPFNSGMTIPIGSEAVFQAVSQMPDAFTDEDTNMLEMLVGHLRGTIDRISLERKLRSLAIHDPLTGAFNRNFFQAALSREKLRAERYNSSIGFLIVDIDNFKKINDLYGHQTGDSILKEVSNFLGETIRETDYLIRYGGDEFLLILIETGQTAVVVRQRILDDPRLAASSVKLIGTPVTLSIGNAHWNPGTGISIQETLAEADKQMYLHKRSKQR